MENSHVVLTRELLLSENFKNQELSLEEVTDYGCDRYGDPDHLKIYGLSPKKWHSKGIRLLGRMAAECVRDPLGQFLSDNLHVILHPLGDMRTTVIDPFAGSCNLLLWAKKGLAATRSVGWEHDIFVYNAVCANLRKLDAEVEYIFGDFRDCVRRVTDVSGHRIAILLSPPWGAALSDSHGLDLLKTTPPVPSLIDFFTYAYGAKNTVIFIVQIHERVASDALLTVQGKLTWSETLMEPGGVPGHRSGFLIGESKRDGFRQWPSTVTLLTAE